MRTRRSVQGGSTVNDGRWHFVTAIITTSTTVPSGNTVHFYLDGQSDTTLTGSTYDYGTPQWPLHLGARDNGGAPFYQGSLDDVRIYNRGLTTADITTLYQGTQPPNCDQYCVGWWKFDDGSGSTAVNSVATGTAGTLTNFTFNSYGGWVTGIYSGALMMNGTNGDDYVDTGTGPATEISTDAITAEAWAYSKAWNATDSYVMSDNRDCCDTTHAGFGLSVDNQGIENAVFTVSAVGSTIGSVSGNTALSTGQWYFLTGTFDGTYLRIYVNGRLDNTAVISSSALGNPASSDLIIGELASNHAYGWDGIIDDVKVYNRSLTDYEVYDQYLAGAP